jgi:hypothetical protein
MSKHSFILTYDTDTREWEWDTEQEGNRLDGLTYAPDWSVINYEQVGYSREPIHFALEDELANKIGFARRTLNDIEKHEDSLEKAVKNSPRFFDCVIRFAGEEQKQTRRIGILPLGYEGDTESLPNDDKVFYWLDPLKLYEGYKNPTDGWEIEAIEVE